VEYLTNVQVECCSISRLPYFRRWLFGANNQPLAVYERFKKAIMITMSDQMWLGTTTQFSALE
jgi:hypothetical protein